MKDQGLNQQMVNTFLFASTVEVEMRMLWWMLGNARMDSLETIAVGGRWR